MKRAGDQTHEARAKVPRRQDPVSCNFCRTKKLKCNRVNPCSNCLTRKVQCVFATQNGTPSTVQATRESSSETSLSVEYSEVRNSSNNSVEVSNIDNRLRRLEQLAQLAFTNPNPSNHPNLPPQQLRTNDRPSSTSYDLASSLVPFSDTSTRKTEQNAIDTANDLESLAINIPCVYSLVWENDEKSIPEHLASSLITTTHKDASQYSMPKPTWADIVSILPSLETGTALLEHYTKEVNWIYHILHIPTTTAQMKDNYDNLAADRPCDYGQIALLATVFATSAYFIHPSSSISQTTLRNMSRKDTLQCVHRWSHLAFHCLSQARYVANPTIETIQAVILLSHFLLMDDGATATYMALLMTMINAARILNIHKIDSKKSIKEREDALRRGEKVDFLELELKRRIWWHLASSDWVLAFFSGPQASTYAIQPNQFNVCFPLNIDDVNLTSTMTFPSVDPTQPSQMTYFLVRCKMSIIFREIIDYANAEGIDIEEFPYDQVLYFDKKCRELISSFPYWLQLDTKSLARSRQIHKDRPYIAKARLLAHFGINNRLTRLHRGYLIRGINDPRYAYSRMMCLRSARAVIELEKEMYVDYGSRGPKQIWFVIHHLFVATVILSMDYCFNQEDMGNERRKQEIIECCQALERSQEESEIARRGVEQLKRVLTKWRGKVDGDLRLGEKTGSMSESRSSPPVVNAMDANYLNHELNFLTSPASKHPAPVNSVPPMHDNLQGPHELPNPNTAGTFEGDAASGFNGDYTNFDWMTSFDFDAQSGAGVDWESLFRDLENPAGGV